jgi:RHS repeat-associated protein
MLSDGVLNHAWDAENRLVCVSNAAAFATCAYDHSGRRVRRETFDPSTGAKLKTVTCAYDGWNLIRETSVAGPLAVPDIPAGGGAWTETRGDEIWVFSTVETEPDEWYFYHSAFHVTDDMGDTINVPETIGKLCDSNFEAPVPYPWYPSLGPNNIAPGAQWDVYGDRFYYGGVYDFTDDSGAPTGIIYLFANSLWPAPNWCEFLAADQLFPLNSDGSVPDFLPLAPGTPGVTAWIQSVPALVTNITRYPLAPGATNTVHYFWGSDLSGTLQGAGGVGGLIAVSIDGQYYFPCYDHNGNIMVYVSESGSVVAHYAYTPFGEVMSASGPMADAFRFRFSTKYQDAATGLYYYGYRFYDPVMMRFLNRDPIGEDGGDRKSVV